MLPIYYSIHMSYTPTQPKLVYSLVFFRARVNRARSLAGRLPRSFINVFNYIRCWLGRESDQQRSQSLLGAIFAQRGVQHRSRGRWKAVYIHLFSHPPDPVVVLLLSLFLSAIHRMANTSISEKNRRRWLSFGC